MKLSKQEIVCALLDESILIIKDARSSDDKAVIEELSGLAIETLSATYRPMLEGYYEGEYCKETYCNVRDYRDTAITYLDYAQKTASEAHLECLNDVKDYLCEALCWTEKAQSTLCAECSSDSCDDNCRDSCDDNCRDSCDDSCSDSCDDSCSDSCDDSCSDSCSNFWETGCDTSCDTICDVSCDTSLSDSCNSSSFC